MMLALCEPSSPRVRAALESAAAEVDAWRSDAAEARKLAQIERAVLRRTAGRPIDVLAAHVDRLARAAAIDADVPTASRLRAAQGIKRGVKALIGFYAHHLAHQVRSLGEATVNLGRAASAEIGRLDDEVSALRAEVAELERTVGELSKRAT